MFFLCSRNNYVIGPLTILFWKWQNKTSLSKNNYSSSSNYGTVKRLEISGLKTRCSQLMGLLILSHIYTSHNRAVISHHAISVKCIHCLARRRNYRALALALQFFNVLKFLTPPSILCVPDIFILYFLDTTCSLYNVKY